MFNEFIEGECMGKYRVEKINKIFNKVTKSKYIYESILYLENTKGDFSNICEYGGKNIDTPLLMASITKLFTTTCILIMNERKLLSLDDKICQYFSDSIIKGLHVYRGKEYSYDLTISDLLYQVSGLPDVFMEGKTSAKKHLLKEDFYVDFIDMIKWVKSLKPHFPPRTSNNAHYADINFDILGEIIEKVTNLSLDEVFNNYIFKPLGLKNTYLPASENDFVPSIYYKDKKLHRVKCLLCSKASGGYITTSRELMIFIKAFFGGKLFNKTIFKNLAYYKKLQFNMGPINYGGGYMHIPLGGLLTMFMGKGEIIGHSGSTGSFAFYYPEKDLFIVGDLNQMSSPALPIRLLLRLALSV